MSDSPKRTAPQPPAGRARRLYRTGERAQRAANESAARAGLDALYARLGELLDHAEEWLAAGHGGGCRCAFCGRRLHAPHYPATYGAAAGDAVQFVRLAAISARGLVNGVT